MSSTASTTVRQVIDVVDNLTPPLRQADRSDACGSSQAVIRVMKIVHDCELTLDFDYHNFNVHEPALVADGWAIEEDLRASLTNR